MAFRRTPTGLYVRCIQIMLLFISNDPCIAQGDQQLTEPKLDQSVCHSWTRCPRAQIPTNGNDTAQHNDCCLVCSCDSVSCVANGNCCPDTKASDVLRQINNTNRIGQCLNHMGAMPSNQNGTGTDVATNAANLLVAKVGVVMVTSCAADQNATRCTQPDADNVEDMLPVTVNGQTFRNRFCVECNMIEETASVIPWTPRISCSEVSMMQADIFYFPNTVRKMLKLAYEKRRCAVEYLPPKLAVGITDSSLCLVEENSIDAMSTCPVDHSDKEVVGLCEQSEDTYLPYMHTYNNTSVVYHNYFCYLCNTGDAENENHCPAVNADTEAGEYDDNVLELNTRGLSETAFMVPWFQNDLTPARYIPRGTQCEKMKTYDPFTEKCREWYCPSERYLLDGQCIPILEDVVNATFGVPLKITPDDNSVAAFLASNKTTLLMNVLDFMYGDDDVTDKRIIIIAVRKEVVYVYAFVLLTVRKHSIQKAKVFDPKTYGQNVSIATDTGIVSVDIDLAVGVKIEMSTFILTDVLVIDLAESFAMTPVYREELGVIEQSFQYTGVTKLAFCTQILLDKTEIHDYIDIVSVRVSTQWLYHGQFVRKAQYDDVRVCLSDYLQAINKYLQDTASSDEYPPQAIVSAVCNLLSIIGLVLTIFTYLIFDELQSVPGQNNMMLSIHLLIAQCLYQFGIDKTEHVLTCIVLGIFIHLFWLVTIIWMNACTLHMFRMFVTGHSSYRSIRKCDPQVFYYTLYCYGIGCMLVGVNIGVSMYKSDGANIGYGGNICYISEPTMVGWVFALPVGVVIILNLGFFFAVVYHISASSMRGRNKSYDRANTVIYMKLSTLTGVTWIFGFIFIWTKFDPMEYIFIVLNAGQGVFIFISFICTRRIMRLYVHMFRTCCANMRKCACACACADATVPKPDRSRSRSTSATATGKSYFTSDTRRTAQSQSNMVMKMTKIKKKNNPRSGIKLQTSSSFGDTPRTDGDSELFYTNQSIIL